MKHMTPLLLALCILIYSVPIYAADGSGAYINGNIKAYVNGSSTPYISTDGRYIIGSVYAGFYYRTTTARTYLYWIYVSKEPFQYSLDGSTYRNAEYDENVGGYVNMTSSSNTNFKSTNLNHIEAEIPVFQFTSSITIQDIIKDILSGGLNWIPEPEGPPGFDGTGEYDESMDHYSLHGNTWENDETEILGTQLFWMGMSNSGIDPGYGSPDLWQIMVPLKNKGTEWLNVTVDKILGFFPSGSAAKYAIDLLLGKDGAVDLYCLDENGEEKHETIQTELKKDEPFTVYSRPVKYDEPNDRYIVGNWQSYTSIGDTVVNRYNVQNVNNTTYTTNVQYQTQVSFDWNPPANSDVVTFTPPEPGTSGTNVTNVYNYYTTYEAPTNNYVENITNNYFSYPAANLEPDPDVDNILEGVTPANFFGFLKKLLKYVIKLFNMFAGCLTFLPLWAQVVVKAVVPIFGIVIIGIIIIKGVL